MRTHFKSVVSVTVMGIALVLTCPGHEAGAQIVVTPPAVVVSPPVVVGPVPDFYVWDGDEYVGVVGSQYYYLGPGNIWMVMDPPRLHRFQTWERGNPNWRSHATRNTHYRNSGRPTPPSTRSAGAPQQHPASNGHPSSQNQGNQYHGGTQNQGNQGQENHGHNNPPQ
jgi:hypothetical protein